MKQLNTAQPVIEQCDHIPQPVIEQCDHIPQPVIEQCDHIPQPVIEQCNHIPQLLSIKNVCSYTGLSRSTIYEIINEKSDRYDPTFPKKVQLTQVRVVWVANEIAEWINTKMEERSA